MGQRLLQPLRLQPCLCRRRGGSGGILGCVRVALLVGRRLLARGSRVGGRLLDGCLRSLEVRSGRSALLVGHRAQLSELLPRLEQAGAGFVKFRQLLLELLLRADQRILRSLQLGLEARAAARRSTQRVRLEQADRTRHLRGAKVRRLGPCRAWPRGMGCRRRWVVTGSRRTRRARGQLCLELVTLSFDGRDDRSVRASRRIEATGKRRGERFLGFNGQRCVLPQLGAERAAEFPQLLDVAPEAL